MAVASLIIAIIIIVLLLSIAVRLRLLPVSKSSTAKPEAYYDLSETDKYPHKWGYADTQFEFDDPRSVKVTGNRYPISGFRMPHLVPFVEEILGFSIRPEDMVEGNQTHDIPNLFVVGPMLIPGAVAIQPTLTIVALGNRIGEYIANNRQEF